jgi:predicted nucleic acid-binding protein
MAPIDVTIAERAANLRAQYNLRIPDALQIAASLNSECQAFLTNDPILMRVTELRVLVLNELEL